MSDDICGAETTGDQPCQNPATEGDSCWIEAHGGHAEPGRPSKFTEDRAETAIDAARLGVSKAGCARAAGVGEATLARWLEEHDDFRSGFAQARAEGEQRVLQDGLTGDADPSMAKFLLSTSFGYIKTERREHGGDLDVGGELVVDFENSDT